jgi:glycosyltransferase involved in cell wall biosynthesis
MKPFFSIVIPVFKTEPFLEECLLSVINQSFKDFECIVINDGSPGVDYEDFSRNQRSTFRHSIDVGKINKTDQVKHIFQSIALNDPRFILIEKQNEGLGPTKNRGIGESKGERLIILDSDDYLESNYLQKAKESIKYKNQIYFGQLKNLENSLISAFEAKQKFVAEKNILKSLLVFPTWSITPINYFWKVDIIKKYNIRYRFKNKGEDSGFLVDNIIAHYKEGGDMVFNKIESFYIYRQFPEQMTKTDGFEIELFDHTTTTIKSQLKDLKEMGFIYYVLGILFIFRFTLYRKRLVTSNILLKNTYSIFAKLFTIFALLISGTKKL